MVTVTRIATAIGTVLTAMALLAGALPALIKVLRKMTRVEHLVNQQNTNLNNYIRALKSSLVKAGIDIPEDQSNPGPGPAAGPPS